MSIDFYNIIGAQRKEARLRFLKNYRTSKLGDLPNVLLNAELDVLVKALTELK